MKPALTLLFLVYFCQLNAQCTGNLVTNGSFTGNEGELVTATGWIPTSTPDLNDAVGPLNTSPGYIWTGTPVPSSDGGTWQNLFDMETVEQFINVIPGEKYCVQFEYTSQGILVADYPELDFQEPVGVTIYLNNELVETTPADQTPFSWEKYGYSFTAQGNVMNIKFGASGMAYVAIDGVCVSHYPATIDLGSDTTLCLGETLTLHADGSPTAEYLWQDNSTGQTYTVTQPGTYFVKVTEGCSVTDSIRVFMIDCSPEPGGPGIPEPNPKYEPVLEMPNIFTPDGDGSNDSFHAKKMIGISKAHLQIFNRWGELMIETDNLLQGWNGKVKDQIASEGTYFWIVNYITYDQKESAISGFLELIR